MNWADIASEFRDIRGLASGITFPSQDEIDCYKASCVKSDLISSNLRRDLRLGKWPLVQGEDKVWMLGSILEVLGYAGPDHELPDFIRSALRDHLAIVEQSIITETLTLDFLHSWGEAQRAFGGLLALLICDDAVSQKFLRGLDAGVKSSDVTLQKYWYAHWMVAHGYLEQAKARWEWEDELADLCGDIDHDLYSPILHDKAWFKCLIEYRDKDIEEESKQATLKSTYTRLPKAEIQRMSKNSLIPRSALPPLTVDAFAALSDDVP